MNVVYNKATGTEIKNAMGAHAPGVLVRDGFGGGQRGPAPSRTSPRGVATDGVGSGVSVALVNKEQLFRTSDLRKDNGDDQGAGVWYSDRYALAAKSRYIFRQCLTPREVFDGVDTTYDEDGHAHQVTRYRHRLPAVALCCTARPDVDGIPVYADKDGHGHGVGHLVHCSSLWCCPVCAPYIAAGRGDEIRHSLSEAKDRGYGVEWVTLTVRHSREDGLETLLALLQDAWHTLMACRAMRKFKEKTGWLAYVRRTEVTYSVSSGFHPHFHTLVYFDHPLTDEEHAEFVALVASMWQRFLLRHEKDGADRTINEHGYKVDRVDLTDDGQVKLAGYVTKIASVGGLALEMSDGGRKSGRGDSYGMFEILRLIDLRDKDWRKSWQCRVWLEYYYATKGKKVFHYSSDYSRDGELIHAGFKTLFGLKEKEDEEIAEEQAEEYRSESETIGVMAPDAWAHVLRLDPQAQGAYNLDMAHDDVSRFGDYDLTAVPAVIVDESSGEVFDATSWGVPLWYGVLSSSEVARCYEAFGDDVGSWTDGARDRLDRLRGEMALALGVLGTDWDDEDGETTP